MSQVIATFSIVDFLPNDFNFTDFSFVINSESRDFEQEISFASKNKISHKFIIPKKDIKYSIKVIRKNSLIGISEISLPCTILQKKEKTYQKTCTINTTDSVKRVLFGNVSQDNALKIDILCEFDYKEKNIKINYSSSTTKKPKGAKNLKDIRSSGTFSHKNMLDNKKSNNTNLIKQNSSSKTNNSNIKSPKIIKPKTQMFDNGNIDIKQNKKKEFAKSDKKIMQRKKEINDIIINQNNNKQKNNESIIDDELNKEIKENDDEFYNYMNDYFKGEYPLEKLDALNDVKELSEYTKNSILELIEYQMKFYSLYKKSLDKQKKFKNLLLQYNEKYRNTKKEINKLDELIDICEIKSEITDINKFNKEKKFLTMKENELNNFNDICYGKKITEDKKKENEDDDKAQIMEKGKNVLIKVLKQCIDKYGPINKIFTLTNSTEPERINIRKLANKYNLPLTSEIKEEDELNIPKKEENEENEENINKEEHNEQNEQNDKNILEEKAENLDIVNNDKENDIKEIEKEEPNKEEKNKNIFEGKITKWEYVSTDKPDNIDTKLELYLKYFYPKRNLPIIIFKKTSTNNYEYGKQKVMIKIEGDTIRVRHLGSYLILDKFIELNAATEEKKLKKNNEKNTNADSKTSKKKEIIQKKKK